MTWASWAFARSARLRPADSRRVAVERQQGIPMPDGVNLLADRWYSPATASSDPVVLIRSPYGRNQFGLFGRLFAERGYQVLVQSCRGTGGSGGDSFDPFRDEQSDGLATLHWIAEQPWFSGSVGCFGASYMGLTSWAVASSPPPFLKAMALQITSARVRDAVFPGGTFALQTGANWVQQLNLQGYPTGRFLWEMVAGRRRLALAYKALPLGDVDLNGFGLRIPFYQEWLAHTAVDDPWWDPLDWSKDVGVAPPVSLVAGWYDLFLPGEIEDFRRLREAGRDARLTVGAWSHTSLAGAEVGVHDGLEWFDEHLRGQPPSDRPRVKLFVMGSKRWAGLDQWPPPYRAERWFLRAGGALSPEGAADSEPDRFCYDPSDPAPGLGGPSLDAVWAGRREQKKRERRPDVLNYTTGVLRQAMTIAGPVNTSLWVRCNRPSFDLFARLCDVSPSGRSYNVCDGIIRLNHRDVAAGPEGVAEVRLALWPTAQTFATGHRIRLQVSTAAHPLYARNPGGDEPFGMATTLHPGEMEVFHDAEHPSAVELPVSPI